MLEAESELTDQLWVRGGFPHSLLAGSDAGSLPWQRDFIRTYLERDIPQFGPRIAAETLRRFWTMLVDHQSCLLNAAGIARGLGVDGKTVASALDLLVDLLLVRRLSPWHSNAANRLVKSPKVYVRDNGLVHALLGLWDLDAILGHPVAGRNWEGFVVDMLIGMSSEDTIPSFYRTGAGAGIDLLLSFPDGSIWAIEVKRSLTPKLEKGFHIACEDLKPDRKWVVHPGNDRFPMGNGIEVVGLPMLAKQLVGQ